MRVALSTGRAGRHATEFLSTPTAQLASLTFVAPDWGRAGSADDRL